MSFFSFHLQFLNTGHVLLPVPLLVVFYWGISGPQFPLLKLVNHESAYLKGPSKLQQSSHTPSTLSGLQQELDMFTLFIFSVFYLCCSFTPESGKNRGKIPRGQKRKHWSWGGDYEVASARARHSPSGSGFQTVGAGGGGRGRWGK